MRPDQQQTVAELVGNVESLAVVKNREAPSRYWKVPLTPFGGSLSGSCATLQQAVRPPARAPDFRAALLLRIVCPAGTAQERKDTLVRWKAQLLFLRFCLMMKHLLSRGWR